MYKLILIFVVGNVPATVDMGDQYRNKDVCMESGAESVANVRGPGKMTVYYTCGATAYESDDETENKDGKAN